MTSAFWLKKSVIFPLPSSPHCEPTTTTDEIDIHLNIIFNAIIRKNTISYTNKHHIFIQAKTEYYHYLIRLWN